MGENNNPVQNNPIQADGNQSVLGNSPALNDKNLNIIPNNSKPQKATWKIVLLTLGVVIILVVGLFGCVYYLSNRTYNNFINNEKPQAIALVDNFIQLANQDKIEQAYDLFSDEAKSTVSLDQFKQKMEAFKGFSENYINEDSDLKVTSVNQSSKGEITVSYQTQANFSDGVGTLSATIVKKDGQWRIYRVNIANHIAKNK